MTNAFRKITLLSVLGLLALSSGNAYAAFSPVGISIFPPVQFPPSDFTITGARLNLPWGDHHSVFGFDIGIANVTRQTMTGIQVGVLNVNGGMTNAIGLQVGAIGNFNTDKANVYGLQLGLINFNRAESMVVGLGIAAYNNTPFTKVIGAQVGLFNKANTVYGFQVGIVNSTDSLHGIQVGLLNFNTRGLFSVSPGLNIGF